MKTLITPLCILAAFTLVASCDEDSAGDGGGDGGVAGSGGAGQGTGAGNGSAGSGGANGTAGSGCYTPTTKFGDQMCKRAFGSNHTSGLNFVMADGSVRFISYSVSVPLFQAAATMQGGEVNSLP